MSRLPRIRTGSADLDAALEQWKATIDPALAGDEEPLLVPRNARTEKPATNTIRLRWDPGSLHSEGHDVSYSETPDFAQSQSHRVQGREALYFDLVVQDTNKRYFRVRSFRGELLSRWSNIVAGTADIAVAGAAPAGVAPGAITFTPTLRNKFGFIGIKDLTAAGVLTALTELHLAFCYVDEAAAQVNYAILGAIDASTNPITVAATEVGAVGWFEIGQLVVVDDPAADTVKVGRRAYEVFKIQTIAGGNWTLARAQLDSSMLAHSAGLRAYLVDKENLDPALGPGLFETAPPVTASGLPDTYWQLLPGAAVVAVAGQLRNPTGAGPVTIVNCNPLSYPFPGDEHQDNPAPGLRTLADDLYTLPVFGALSVGQTMTVRVRVREGVSLAGGLCTVRIAPTGAAFFSGLLGGVNCALAAYLLYVEPRRLNLPHGERKVAVLDQWTVPSGDFDSERPMSLLNQRRVPYTLEWPFRGVVVGLLGDLFNLTTGAFFTASLPLVATGVEIATEEGGELDVLIAQIGSTISGTDLAGFLLT